MITSGSCGRTLTGWPVGFPIDRFPASLACGSEQEQVGWGVPNGDPT